MLPGREHTIGSEKPAPSAWAVTTWMPKLTPCWQDPSHPKKVAEHGKPAAHVKRLRVPSRSAGGLTEGWTRRMSEGGSGFGSRQHDTGDTGRVDTVLTQVLLARYRAKGPGLPSLHATGRTTLGSYEVPAEFGHLGRDQAVSATRRASTSCQERTPVSPEQNNRPWSQNNRPWSPEQNNRPWSPEQNNRPWSPEQNNRPWSPEQNNRPW